MTDAFCGWHLGCQTAFSAPSVWTPFDFALTHGFAAFEWFPDKKETGAGWNIEELTARERDGIYRVGVERGLRLSVHAGLPATPLTQAGAAQLTAAIAFAAEIGARLVNLHLDLQRGLPAFIRAIRPLARLAWSQDIALAVENTPQSTPEHFNRLFAQLREDPSLVNIGMCLDIGHANLCAKTPNDYLGFIDRLDRDVPITHLHLHENWGDADSHLPLFHGPSADDPSNVFGLCQRLNQRGFVGSGILEQWPDPPELLIEVRRRLLALASGSPNQPDG